MLTLLSSFFSIGKTRGIITMASWLFFHSLLLHLLLLFAVLFLGEIQADDITYDGRSLIINGERKILFSGSIHYPRSTPEMWPSLISKAKDGGLDVIQTYVFWNLHEPQQGQYDFNGRNDIVRFIKEIQAHGLYATLRIGPFVEAEWTYGGFPVWLRDIPNIVFRTDNEPFKAQMQKFVSFIVNMMKEQNLYAPQGGPIILSQIENEYGNIEGAFGPNGPSYVRWAAAMAVGLQTGINTCNGMKCGETFKGPNSPNKPSMWTENWTSFLQAYGEQPYIRTPQVLAFHVALFIAKNGSFVNYYMYGHLKELHDAVKSCSDTLLSNVPKHYIFETSKEAFVFGDESAGKCVAFLMNNSTAVAKMNFNNKAYALPAKSISILPDCKNVSTKSMKRVTTKVVNFKPNEKWMEFKENIPNYDDAKLHSNTLLDQISTTKDTTDYLWYTLSFQNNNSDSQATIKVTSMGHDSGPHLEKRVAGLRRVKIWRNKRSTDLSNNAWGYQVGLNGENAKAYSVEDSTIQWGDFTSINQPLTWYKATGNSLVLMEEEGGDPRKISIDRITIRPARQQHESNIRSGKNKKCEEYKQKNKRPNVELNCPPSLKQSRILL
ncbi:hypothetical protein V2J09_007632 [Rumex salicifolius]